MSDFRATRRSDSGAGRTAGKPEGSGRVRPLRGVVRHRTRSGRGSHGGDRGTVKQRRGRPSIGNENVRLSSNEKVRLRSGADRGEAGRSGACSTTSRSRSTLHRQREGHQQRGWRRGDRASRPASSGGRQDRGGRRLRPERGWGREGRPAAAEGSRRRGRWGAFERVGGCSTASRSRSAPDRRRTGRRRRGWRGGEGASWPASSVEAGSPGKPVASPVSWNRARGRSGGRGRCAPGGAERARAPGWWSRRRVRRDGDRNGGPPRRGAGRRARRAPSRTRTGSPGCWSPGTPSRT